MSLAKSVALFIWDFVQTVAISLGIFLVLYLLVFQPHQVKGLSMYPTFHSDEYLLTNKLTYRFNQPQRGDVVVFKAPSHEEYDYIKRIIALPGERVKLMDGKFYVNGKPLDESGYLVNTDSTYGESFLREGVEIIVPDNTYFVAGDNRTNSSDSRDFGPVPAENIVGKAWFRYWPVNRLGIIGHVTAKE